MSNKKHTKLYIKEFNVEPIERKHIILMDGTWNDESGLNANGLVTNIAHLNWIFKDDGKKQIVRYHRGTGNDNDNGTLKRLWKGLNGNDVEEIVNTAYARMVQDWCKGDRIYIFGFSRGAAAARMLASKIDRDGIPPRISITLRAKTNKETKVVEQIMCHHEIERPNKPHKVDIEFLGIWDTVSAFGWRNILLRFFMLKTRDRFTDNHIASNIKKAVHLLAIDETRNPFVPSLMNQKTGVTHEVWFPGVHSDIGGSNAQDSLAKHSLYYMMKQLRSWNGQRNLQHFVFDRTAYKKYMLKEIDRAFFHLYGIGIGEKARPIGVQVNGKIEPNIRPLIHELYHIMASKRNAYSVIEVKVSEDTKETRYVNFQYMPFNAKVLDGEYEIVR